MDMAAVQIGGRKIETERANGIRPPPGRGRIRSMYFEIVSQMKKQLEQLDKWLDAASAHAKSRSFEADVFLTMRLAPDQFAFVRQVQAACDQAKYAASRTSGVEAPSQPDTEQTVDDLHARIRATVKYLDRFSAGDFEGASTRVVALPRWEGKSMSATDYLVEHSQPNFFFHLSHAYAILRHAGVPLGKRDFLGALTFRPAA
jgi:hypothetical protein